MSFTGCSLGILSSHSNWLTKAEEATSRGDFPEAIDAYHRHIEKRLASRKPDWENPHFYHLKIGDIYLRQDEPENAIKAYLAASENGVDSHMISDRIRAVARWYENAGQLQAALQLLTTHRELDSLLFDSMLDRVARELSAEEAKSSSVPSH